MTQAWLSPFVRVARWGQQALPAGLRGLTVRSDLAADVPAGARLRLDLPEAALLWRDLDLPALPPDRRRAWIEARLEEVSPWAAGAFLWAEGPATGERLRVAMVAAEPLRALDARLRAGGGRLVEVTGGGRWLIEDAEGQTRLARGIAAAWALVLALGLGLAGLALQRDADAAARLALAEGRLARLAQMATATSAASEAARAMLAQKTEAASLAAALDRLAASLPLDSHLETLRLTPQDFTISGKSAAPEAIIPALEGTGGFVGVDFAGASARDADGELYSFTLSGRTGAP